jgi:hypothetical protein
MSLCVSVCVCVGGGGKLLNEWVRCLPSEWVSEFLSRSSNDLVFFWVHNCVRLGIFEWLLQWYGVFLSWWQCQAANFWAVGPVIWCFSELTTVSGWEFLSCWSSDMVFFWVDDCVRLKYFWVDDCVTLKDNINKTYGWVLINDGSDRKR